LKEKRPLRRAALRLAAVGGLYAAASAVLAITGAVPAAPVIAGLDVDNYYAWQMLFVLPLVLAVWILASGVLLTLGKKGSRWSAVLARTARAWGGPLFVAWVPSFVQAAFMACGMGQEEWVGILSEPGVWQTAYLAFFAAAGAAAVLRFVLAARTVHKTSWPAAVLTGLAAAVLAVGAYVLFVR
jgi:hypothetical protein